MIDTVDVGLRWQRREDPDTLVLLLLGLLSNSIHCLSVALVLVLVHHLSEVLMELLLLLLVIVVVVVVLVTMMVMGTDHSGGVLSLSDFATDQAHFD